MKTFTMPTIAITEALPYRDILNEVQKYMSQYHTQLLKDDVLTQDNKFLFKQLIDTFLREQNIISVEYEKADLITRIFRDMKEYSFLTPYLEPAEIAKLGLEEIRVNSWESVYLITSKQGKIRLKDKFLSPTHAQDIINRLLQKSNMIMDNTKPYALGHIGKNQRIASFKAPILDEEIGVSATMRIVSFSNLTRENLITWETATEEMLDFLEVCLQYGISMCVSGATGSGKTGTTGYLLSTVTQDDSIRVLTIEEGSREFDLIKRDEQGNVINDVVHTLTRITDDEKSSITQNFLLAMLMRYTPKIIGIGEMRSVEAYTAIEASYTDHTIITTTHAKNAKDTYARMVMLATKGTNFAEDSLMDKAVNAFPLIVHQKQMVDGTRRITEIFEGTGYEKGKIQGRMLYQYKVEKTEYDESGNAMVYGKFEKCNAISDALKERLRNAGVALTALQRFEEGVEY